MPTRLFVELPAETVHSNPTMWADCHTYTGKTTGGEVVGVTGGERMIMSESVTVTLFVDVTEMGWPVVEWTA